MNKRALRQTIKQKRAALDQAVIAECAEKIYILVAQLKEYQTANTIAAYLPHLGEADPSHLIEQAWQAKKRAYVPVIELETKALHFVHYSNHSQMKSNAYGILEPKHNEPRITLDNLDIIFMPLVAFDLKGNRLGMGAGFYDRTLAHLNTLPQKPLLLGLAYEFQRHPKIEAESWDVPIDGVVTEEKIYWFD